MDQEIKNNLLDVPVEDPQNFDYGQVIRSKRIIGFFSHVANKKYYFDNAKYLSLVPLQDFKNERIYKGKVGYRALDRNKLKEKNERFSEHQQQNTKWAFDYEYCPKYINPKGLTLNKVHDEVNEVDLLEKEDPAPAVCTNKRGLTEYLNKCKGPKDDPNKFRVKASPRVIKALHDIAVSPFQKFSKSFIVWRAPGSDPDIFHIQLKRSPMIIRRGEWSNWFESKQYGYVFEDLFGRQAYDHLSSRFEDELRYNSRSPDSTRCSTNSDHSHRKQFSVVSSWEFPEFYLDYRHEVDAFACSSVEDTREELLTLGPQVEAEHLSSFLALLQSPVEMKIRKEGRFEEKFNYDLLAELSSELVLTNSTLLLGLWDEKLTKDGERIDVLKEVICSEEAKEWDSKINYPKGPAGLNFVYNFILKICETIRGDEEESWNKENEEAAAGLAPKKPRKKMNKRERRNKGKGSCQRKGHHGGAPNGNDKDYVFTYECWGFDSRSSPSRQILWSSQSKKDMYWGP